MKRIVTAANGVVFQPANANEWQDRDLGCVAADSNNDYASGTGKGMDGRLWQPSGGSLANATAVKIDSSVDWRDRVFLGWYANAGSAGNLPGGASDYDFRTGVAAANYFHGYTGIGAYSNITTGAAVSNGNAPVAGAGAFRSYRVEAAANVYLYADPTTGALYLYNNSGATIYPAFLLFGTGDTGKR